MVTKCDICKKEIKDSRYSVRAYFNYGGYEFCANCNIPLIKFLKKHNIINKEDNKRHAG